MQNAGGKTTCVPQKASILTQTIRFELLHHVVVFLLHVAVSAIDRSSLSGLERNLGLGSALTTYGIEHLSGTLIESTASLERHLLFSPFLLYISRSGFPTLPIEDYASRPIINSTQAGCQNKPYLAFIWPTKLSKEKEMHGTGFEPAKALSHQILSLAPLTAWVPVRVRKGIR